MTNKSFEAPNIGCAGCVQAIKMELEELAGVRSVSGDAPSKTIQVAFDAPATWEAIAQTLQEIGYPPASE